MSNNCDETKCNGDCSSCGGDGVTVTLTLDDDSTVECAIVGIFDGGDKEYIALLPLDENGQNEDGEVYLYRYSKDAAGQPKLEISSLMKSMRLLLMHSMNCWIPWSTTNWYPRMN